jgi:DNA polymerase III sliding clamp (beta) subunit (PCNA family)
MLMPKAVAKSMVSFASTGVGRYTLVGVSLKRTSDPVAPCEAVATNGKVLAMARWKDNTEEFPAQGMEDIQAQDGFSAIVPAGSLAEASKGIPKAMKNGTLAILQNVAIQERGVDGHIQLGTTDLSHPIIRTVDTVEGTYPQYENAFPKIAPAIRIRFDVRILSAALKAMSGMVDSEQVDICIWEPDRPIVVKGKLADGGTVDVLVMPLVIE